jgi:hypothetical protein
VSARADDGRRRQLRVGIVGAGRSRNGLGPFLAQAFERFGCAVTGVAGRNAVRAESSAASLGVLLGHPVRAFADVASLCGSGIDALVVASPQDAHLASIEAAADQGVACLCEKPICGSSEVTRAVAVLLGFAERGTLVAENVQWPENLPVLDALHGSWRAGSSRRVELGLSPTSADPREMLEDSLPHLLSLAWAVAGLRHGDRLEWERSKLATLAHGSVVLEARFLAPSCTVDARLELRQHVEQPRPAWFAIDGRRADRRIGAGYAISFVGGGREVQVEDPLHRLVAGFVRNCAVPASGMRDVQRASMAHAVASRLSLWHRILLESFG